MIFTKMFVEYVRLYSIIRLTYVLKLNFMWNIIRSILSEVKATLLLL